jgi:hypothetical protein
MQINPTFAFISGATQSDITQFKSAVNTVIAYFDSVFTNVNVTLNVDFAYGEKYLSDNGSTITYQPMANASPTGSVGLGSSYYLLPTESYSTLLSQLKTKTDTNQPSAYATLPTSSPFGNDALLLTLAQEKALGITPGFSVAGFDGVVGIISNEELQAGGFSADWTKAAPSSSNQYYMIGVIEHELTEVMGRVSYDGTNVNNALSYTLMDLFRYSAPGVHQTTNGDPAYFSINNGNNVYYYWNNPALAKGDLGDWAPSGPNGFEPTGNDSFLNVGNSGALNEVSSFDLDLMNVLGWNEGAPATISASTIANDYLAITRTALDPSSATSIANSINAGTETETQFINTLFALTVADTTITAVAVEASMYGFTGTSAEITKLVTQFLPAQVINAESNGFNPIVYASEALGLVFAFGDENGGMAFATNFGPAKAGMPNSTAGDAAFAAAASNTIFGTASTANLINAIDGFVTNWKAFYTSNGIPGFSNATAAQVDLAARGAAWGDAVGVALDNNLGPLKGQAINFLEDAAHGTAVYSASLSSQPTSAPFQGAATASVASAANDVQLTGVAAHVDHIVM